MNSPRGIRNNNPLNIRISVANAWKGKVRGNDPQFETFIAPEYGIRAAVKLFQNRGTITLAEHIAKWAPPSENDTRAYIRAVADASGLNPWDIVNPADKGEMVKIMTAMIMHENGQQPYTVATIAAGVSFADA